MDRLRIEEDDDLEMGPEETLDPTENHPLRRGKSIKKQGGVAFGYLLSSTFYNGC